MMMMKKKHAILLFHFGTFLLLGWVFGVGTSVLGSPLEYEATFEIAVYAIATIISHIAAIISHMAAKKLYIVINI